MIKKEHMATIQTKISLKKEYDSLIQPYEKTDKISNNTNIVEPKAYVQKLVSKRKLRR